MRFGRTTTVRFEEVTARREITGMCKGACGRKLKRVVKETCTINPFHTNADGTVKDRYQVREVAEAKVKKRVAEMERAGLLCKECEKDLEP